MRNLLCADGFRMLHSRAFWLCLGGMLAMAAGFVAMQYTAMDYEVPLSRVIFLPMSFYGVAVAALVSLFVGQDFSDGVIRNKLIAGHSRLPIYGASVVVSVLACAAVFLATTMFAALASWGLFAHDVGMAEIARYTLLGLCTAVGYGCLFATLTLGCGDRTTAVVACMLLAFALLFVSLLTHQVLSQDAYKNGTPNPYYVTGAKRVLYTLLHDLNPTGQVAQLSGMGPVEPLRFALCDLLWVGLAAIGGVRFCKQDVK